MKLLLLLSLFFLCGCEPPEPVVPEEEVQVSVQVAFNSVGAVASWVFSDNPANVITGNHARPVTATITVQCLPPAGWKVIAWQGVASSVGAVATVTADGARVVVARLVQEAGG